MGYRASRFPDAGTPRHDVFRRLCFGWLISCHVKPVFYAADDKMGLDVIISLLLLLPLLQQAGWLSLANRLWAKFESFLGLLFHFSLVFLSNHGGGAALS